MKIRGRRKLLQRQAEKEAALKAKAEEEAAVKAKAEEEAAAKAKAEEEAALKAKAEEEEAAAKTKAEEEAVAKEKAEEEAALKEKAEEEAAVKAKAEEDAATKAKAEEEAALKAKAEEEASAKTKAEKETAAKAKVEEEVALKVKAEEETAAKTKAEEEEAAAEKAATKNVSLEGQCTMKIRGLLCFPGTEPYWQGSKPSLGNKKMSPPRRKAETTTIGSGVVEGSRTGSTNGKQQAGAPRRKVPMQDRKKVPVHDWLEELNSFDHGMVVLRGDFEKHVAASEQRKEQRQRHREEKLRELRSAQNVWRRKHDTWWSHKSLTGSSGNASLDSQRPSMSLDGAWNSCSSYQCSPGARVSALSSQDETTLYDEPLPDTKNPGERRPSDKLCLSGHLVESPTLDHFAEDGHADLSSLMVWAEELDSTSGTSPTSKDGFNESTARKRLTSDSKASPHGSLNSPLHTKASPHSSLNSPLHNSSLNSSLMGSRRGSTAKPTLRRPSKERSSSKESRLASKDRISGYSHAFNLEDLQQVVEEQASNPDFVFESIVDHSLNIFRYVPDCPKFVDEGDDSQRKIEEICRDEGLDVLEVDHMQKVFREADTDRSGYIGQSEFRKFIRDITNCHDEYDIPEKRIRSFWNTIDSDRSGSIDFAEFVQWWCRYGDLLGGNQNFCEEEC